MTATILDLLIPKRRPPTPDAWRGLTLVAMRRMVRRTLRQIEACHGPQALGDTMTSLNEEYIDHGSFLDAGDAAP